jgi:anti-sigma regulatory factor (Ser/Thr protein kinase)
MGACPQAVRSGFRHDAVFYGSDQDVLNVVVDFLEEGVAVGEPTLVALSIHHATLIHSALPGADITYLPDAIDYERPASTIRAYQELFATHVAAGANGIRMVAELARPGVGAPWDAWACFETVMNHAFQAFPLWTLCLYDRRTTPSEMVDEVERTHPHLVTTDGRYVESNRYQDPFRHMAGRPRAFPEVLESEPPTLVLIQPRPSAARKAVAELSEASELDAAEVDDLVVAVSEVVTNAVLHGLAPTTLRAWAGSDRVVVTVHDCGTGPQDPFAGLVPTDKGTSEGGFGLWIAHQFCHRVTLDADDDGFTVRLVAATRR